jgi:hypothetical protein
MRLTQRQINLLVKQESLTSLSIMLQVCDVSTARYVA